MADSLEEEFAGEQVLNLVRQEWAGQTGKADKAQLQRTIATLIESSPGDLEPQIREYALQLTTGFVAPSIAAATAKATGKPIKRTLHLEDASAKEYFKLNKMFADGPREDGLVKFKDMVLEEFTGLVREYMSDYKPEGFVKEESMSWNFKVDAVTAIEELMKIATKNEQAEVLDQIKELGKKDGDMFFANPDNNAAILQAINAMDPDTAMGYNEFFSKMEPHAKASRAKSDKHMSVFLQKYPKATQAMEKAYKGAFLLAVLDSATTKVEKSELDNLELWTEEGSQPGAAPLPAPKAPASLPMGTAGKSRGSLWLTPINKRALKTKEMPPEASGESDYYFLLPYDGATYQVTLTNVAVGPLEWESSGGSGPAMGRHGMEPGEPAEYNVTAFEFRDTSGISISTFSGESITETSDPVKFNGIINAMYQDDLINDRILNHFADSLAEAAAERDDMDASDEPDYDPHSDYD